MTNKIMTPWEPECKVKVNDGGLKIEANWTNKEAMIKNVKNNIHTDILYISSNDGVTPSSFQGYNLKEAKEIRNYLDNLIAIAEEAINN